jgi:predicted YcjX-like family ATPase
VNEGSGSQLAFFDPIHQGRYIATKRVPQANLSVPRFDYENAMSAFSHEQPSWPEPTHGISELRLAIRYQPKNSLLKYSSEMATLNVDITDYPGEWLLDLPMLNQTYKQWSEQMLALLKAQPRAKYAQSFIDKVSTVDPLSVVNEEFLAELSQEYTQLLHTFRYELGLSVIQPGRFILPAELAGAPILEFFPFPDFETLNADDYQNAPDNSFIGMLRARFIEYKEEVVKKFYKQHFVRFDRQIVLVDCLTPLNTCSEQSGSESFNDVELAMSMLLESYQYGKSGLFSRLFSPKIDKLLFAATKADHVTPEQHAPMVSLLNQLIHQSKHRLNYEAIEIKTLAIASVKCTTSGVSLHDGKRYPVIQGCVDDNSGLATNNDAIKGDKQKESNAKSSLKKITVFPGSVPEKLPTQAYWKECAFNFIAFKPSKSFSKNECLPHIRMDQVLQFLLADKMT